MINLKAETRKKSAKTTRKEGKIPAVFYGSEIGNLNLSVNEKEFEQILNKIKETEKIVLNIEGKDFYVLIKEIQKDPQTEKILHVDFFQPSTKEEIEIKVPLVFINTSEAIENFGAILVKNLKEVKIKCLPSDLPKEILVDISKLKNLEDKILISDLKVPEGVKILRKPEEVVAFLVLPEIKTEPKEHEKTKG
jgi:large subunit ribosomal protein L25